MERWLFNAAVFYGSQKFVLINGAEVQMWNHLLFTYCLSLCLGRCLALHHLVLFALSNGLLTHNFKIFVQDMSAE